MPPSPGPVTLAEIFGTLNQLVDAYTQVMATFQSVVADVAQVRQSVDDLTAFVHGELADAVTAARIWRDAAEAHKQQVETLRAQLAQLQR